MQDHIPILILNKILFRKKILIRTSSVILNKKNKFEYNNFKNKKLKILSTYFYRLANIIITYSKANVLTLNSRGVRNVYCIYNHYKKNKIYKTNKKKNLIFFYW